MKKWWVGVDLNQVSTRDKLVGIFNDMGCACKPLMPYVVLGNESGVPLPPFPGQKDDVIPSRQEAVKTAIYIVEGPDDLEQRTHPPEIKLIYQPNAPW